jgi:hypothetical protein
MKMLLVIAGAIAGLSVAHAAEEDDLVSVFEAVCMSRQPFEKALADFAKSRGWGFDAKPMNLVGADPDASGWYPKTVAIAYPPSFGTIEAAVTVHVDTGRSVGGRNLDTCTVRQRGLRVSDLNARVESVLMLPGPAQPVSRDVRGTFGREGPGEKAKQWTLDSNHWDYVVTDESEHMSPHTYIERLKSSN